MAWLMPAVKAILPYLSPIIAATLPVFSSRKGDEAAANQASLVQQQITELQTATSQNAAHVKELAEQLRNTVAALEQGAEIAESRFRRTTALCIAAIAVSVVALCISCIVLFGR
jgi:secreted trypsin-like serine protease